MSGNKKKVSRRIHHLRLSSEPIDGRPLLATAAKKEQNEFRERICRRRVYARTVGTRQERKREGGSGGFLRSALRSGVGGNALGTYDSISLSLAWYIQEERRGAGKGVLESKTEELELPHRVCCARPNPTLGRARRSAPVAARRTRPGCITLRASARLCAHARTYTLD